MKNIKILSVLGLTSFLSTITSAEQLFSIRAEGGLTGYGGAVLYQVNPYVQLALGYNQGKVNWRNHITINNIRYDLDMNNDTPYLNALVYPWAKSHHTWLNSIYAAIGVGYIGDNYDVSRNFKIGDKIPNNFHQLPIINGTVKVEGNVDYSSNISPYMGIGISPKLNNQWRIFAEAGVYYTGDADVHLTHVNGIYVGSIGQKTDYKLDDAEMYRWHPVAKLGLIYTF
ncbi:MULTISPECIES: hypothetical protein [unclassified Acinetobacter]|uniref:hypothetical protein n=1 Tax=unclassified Acinetobacter TaxID=196816 RepID=UPI0029346C5E|nr:MULTISPECIES: hypothetical protein [unclassified Acinetobacter]WOE31900.1 hypothetical protein QSG84_01355 [Acinetobacter sp. SAAs470]WOE37367.1 hypothetical protein QSG86_10400 [Acinetobacter sp. SAAs474]